MCSDLTRDTFPSRLNFIFGPSAVPALDLVDQRSVTRLRSPSGRILYQVQASLCSSFLMVSSWHLRQCFPDLQSMDKQREDTNVLQTPEVTLQSSSHRLELEQHGSEPFSLWLPASLRQFMCLWASQSGGSFPGIANFALLLPSYPAEEVLPLDQLYTTHHYLPSLCFFPVMTSAWQEISAAWEGAVLAKPLGFTLVQCSQGCESQKPPHEMAFWGEELTSALRSVTAQGGSEVRSHWCFILTFLYCAQFLVLWSPSTGGISFGTVCPCCEPLTSCIQPMAVPWLSTGTLCPKDFGQKAPIPSPQHSQPSGSTAPPGLGLVLCCSHTRERGMSLLSAAAPKRNISKYPLCKEPFVLPWRCSGVL